MKYQVEVTLYIYIYIYVVSTKKQTYAMQCKKNFCDIHILIKGGLSQKIKYLHIHLYFVATQYLWNYALVEDID